jgi:hypothetical protein
LVSGKAFISQGAAQATSVIFPSKCVFKYMQWAPSRFGLIKGLTIKLVGGVLGLYFGPASKRPGGIESECPLLSAANCFMESLPLGR